jgi:hypothetical protein
MVGAGEAGGSKTCSWVPRARRLQDPGPINRRDSSPYLEPHHIRPLNDGGPDDLSIRDWFVRSVVNEIILECRYSITIDIGRYRSQIFVKKLRTGWGGFSAIPFGLDVVSHCLSWISWFRIFVVWIIVLNKIHVFIHVCGSIPIRRVK